MIEAAVAPSASQVWAFGVPSTPAHPGYFAHFDGKTWKTGGFPITGTAAAALSPSDVWAGGQAASGAIVVEHWNGHTWTATTLAKAGAAPPGLAWITGIAAVSPRQVWASVSIISGQAPLSYLEHWNGTSWTRVSLPFGGHPVIGTPVASDGLGGVWAGISIGTGSKLTQWFAHYADGKWTKTAMPGVSGSLPPPLDETSPGQLAWIPGTRSLWATGDRDVSDATSVLKYRP